MIVSFLKQIQSKITLLSKDKNKKNKEKIENLRFLRDLILFARTKNNPALSSRNLDKAELLRNSSTNFQGV
ncbi:MAG: hypothetical protein NTW78_09150 [Campylobacterales bacterium]|nr:hypothetical protein [Campylobacterales bacterium]